MDTNIRKTGHHKKTACVCCSSLGRLLVGQCLFLHALDLRIKDWGIASWYGKAFDGKLATNGEVFDEGLHGCSPQIAIGSIVRVINLENGSSVQIRITDRGPYMSGRTLDLSHAAAHELGMAEAGTAPVQIEVVGNHRVVPPAPPGKLSSVWQRSSNNPQVWPLNSPRLLEDIHYQLAAQLPQR